jgi:hypothetical protein
MNDKLDETRAGNSNTDRRPDRPVLRLVSQEERKPKAGQTAEDIRRLHQARTSHMIRPDMGTDDDDPGPNAA